MTGKPVHTRLAWLASHAVLSSTCKIAVSPLNPTSELARTFGRLPAASVNWFLRESGSGASTASTVVPWFDLHAIYMLQPRMKAHNSFSSAISDMAQLSISELVLEA